MPLYARLTARTFAYTLFYTIPPINYFTKHHYEIHRVRGPSMAPSLSPDYHATNDTDYVLFRKNIRLGTSFESEGGSGCKSELERGTVVSFRNPVSGTRAVKRVVALEGDQVVPIPREGDAAFGLDRIEEREVTVPFGHVWVEGDQVEREKTLDSNDYGPISKSLIEGVAVSIVTPLSRRGPVALQGEWEQRCRGRIRLGKDLDQVPEDWAMLPN